MSMNATVNTNLSAVTDPVGNRGNIPNGVMALPLTDPGGSASAVTYGATPGAGIDPTIGSYTAILPQGIAGTQDNGTSQLVTITFSKAHGWSSLTHDLDIQLVGSTDQTIDSLVGMCSGGSFPGGNANPNVSTTLTFTRQVGGVGGAVSTPQLAEARVLITVRKRGVAHVPA